MRRPLTTLRRRALPTAIAAALLLPTGAGCGTRAAVTAGASSTSSSPAVASGPRDCTTSQLSVRVARWSLGTTHTGGHIAFSNHSQRACRVSGWPTLAGVTATGETIVARKVRSTWFGPYVKGVPVVTLRPGQRALAAFAGSDPPPDGGTSCPSFLKLRVTPPQGARAVLLSAWFPPLARYFPRCAQLEVSMVVAPGAFGPSQ